jgi:hypothetical protein
VPCLRRDVAHKHVEVDIAALSTQAGLDETKLSPILPSLKRTSPFNIRFDWQSERGSKRASDLRVPRDDSVQGTSRNRFRLTPLTMTTHPPHPQSYSPSQVSADGIRTSFLDFTNSSEGSSIRTNTFSIQSGSHIFGDPPTQLAQGSRMAELKSRWSDTSSSTRRRDSAREGTIPSSSTDKSSRRKTYHTSTPSIYVTSESQPKIPSQRESDSTLFSTESPMHVHPTISDLGSHRDSLPSQRAADTLFRTSGSDESSATTSRRTTDSSNQFHTRLLLASRYSPLPEGTDEASTSSV